MSNYKLAWWLTSPKQSELKKREAILRNASLFNHLLENKGVYAHEVYGLCGCTSKNAAVKITWLVKSGWVKPDGTSHSELPDSKHYVLVVNAGVQRLLQDLLDRGTP